LEDADGNIVTADNSDVALSIASGPGTTLSGTATVTAVNGVATFSDVFLTTAGPYTLNATDSTDGLPAVTSNPFTVMPAAPAKVFVELGSLPATVTAGSPVTPEISVRVEDAFDNLVSPTSVKLAIATGPHGSTIGGTTKEETGGGVAEFSNVYFKTAGTYALKATASKAVGVSSSLTVNPAAPAKLKITKQPTSGNTNDILVLPLTVSVEDQYGNLVSGSLVTLTELSGPANGLGGTTMATTASNGIAAFDDIIFSDSGSYVLDITDGVVIKSGKITVR
jgi:hypothetical protein